MKIFKTFLYASLLLSALVGQAQTNNGPMVSPKMNGVYYVGIAPYTTIQSTVTAACNSGVAAKVVISPNASPSDTIAAVTSCTTVSLEDQRTAPYAVYSSTGGVFTAVPQVTLSALKSTLASDPRPTALPFTHGDNSAITPPSAGTETLVLGGTHLARMKPDGTTSSLCSSDMTGCPTFSGSGSTHQAGMLPDPGSTAGSYRTIYEDGTFRPTVIQGQSIVSLDYVNSATPTNVNQAPSSDPWNFMNIVTSRKSYNDTMQGVTSIVHFQHGGSNFLSDDLGLPVTNIAGNFMNIGGINNKVTLNTAGQMGGAFDTTVNCYDGGDCILNTAVVNGTGGTRGTDEHLKKNRIFIQWRGNNWGVIPTAITVDANGQANIQPTKDGSNTPQPSPNHDILASAENGAIIDTNPAKVYSVGNVQTIDACPNTVINNSFVMCLTGDTTSAWSSHFGNTNFTQTTSEIGAVAVNNVDPFAAGPKCVDVSVGSTTGATVGSIFTISSAGANYEQPSVLSVGSNSIHACFKYPHASGETVSFGAGIGTGIAMAVDEMAPHTNPGVQNDNASTLRMVYPIIGYLPGNIAVVWVEKAGSFGPEYKTLALNATTPKTPASFTLNTSGGGIPIATDGTQPAWTVNSTGNYYTNSSVNTGNDQLPPPIITFTATNSCTLPTAHTVYAYSAFQLGVTPVTDTTGSGCTGLSFTLQNVWPNPYNIYLTMWARSNRDPSFVDPGLPCTPAGSCQSFLQHKGISASTDGFMQTGSLTPGIVAGDPLEMGKWFQHYISSDEEMSTDQGKSRRNNPTGIGPYEMHGTTGMTGNAQFGIVNNEPFSSYYGTVANGFVPDALHGFGRMPPPFGFGVYGPNSYTWDSETPQNRAGDGDFTSAAIIRSRCHGLVGSPCGNGKWNIFDLMQVQGKKGTLHIAYDSVGHMVRTFESTSDGQYLTQGVDALQISPTSPQVQIGNFEPCDVTRSFRMRSAFGYFGNPDQMYICIDTGAPGYKWVPLTPPGYESLVYSGGTTTLKQNVPMNTVYLQGNTTLTLDTNTTPITGMMCVNFVSTAGSTFTVTYPSSNYNWMVNGEQPRPPSGGQGYSEQCFMYSPSDYFNSGRWLSVTSMRNY